VAISASIGLAFYPDHGVTVSELIEKVERAKTLAKARRKGGVQTFTDYINIDLATREALEQAAQERKAHTRIGGNQSS
jgi:predicted signal transduction protein with EAL and GGDEF domain